ncbi:MAG: AAA family ATPase, partial [Lachnospiraceae bacterium]|nr:AAA family ATPase [Lachnospiraceae bacterium]
MSDYAKMKRLPVIAMRGLVVLPDMVGHIDLKTKDVEGAFRSIMEMDSEVVLATMREGLEKIEDLSSVYPVGVIATIKQRVSLPNGNVRILLEGKTRVVFRDLRVVANGSYLGDVVEREIIRASYQGQEEEARIRMLAELLGEYVIYQPQTPKNLLDVARNTTDLYSFMIVLMAKIPFQAYTKLSFLMQEREDLLFEVLYREFGRELEIAKLRHEINEKISKEVAESAADQRKEYYLKEQLRAIKKELGEDDESDADKFRERLEDLQASDEIKDNIEKEIERFERMQHSASEAAVGYQYLDTLLSIPWEVKSDDNTDLENAKNVLEEDHYGLKDVKERVLEFLAVRALNTKGDTPILCLVGPPGTGKTSIAKSVARAMNRKYERVCLGGVKDEAELRGHRRTYVGAMPGRLVKALLHAKVANPLILLDEVDKLGSDYKGDPAAALLEVLDSEQNANFMDHYVDMPVDLSPVLFLATANDPSNIPRPLLDRMEIIELSSYLETEKYHIGKEHLWPKQLEANGLTKSQVTITDSAIRTVISCYTKEAGVRALERCFGKIDRKAAKQILLGEKKKISVTERNLEEYLGKKKYLKEKKAGKDKVGIATGLPWTHVGG